jgi:hypothetical protein
MAEVESPRQYERLEEAIHEEIRAQTAMRDLSLSGTEIEFLASMIASQIDYNFSYEYSPKWAKPGEPLRWNEQSPTSPSGVWHFRECLNCGRRTKHGTPEEAEADYVHHASARHLT